MFSWTPRSFSTGTNNGGVVQNKPFIKIETLKIGSFRESFLLWIKKKEINMNVISQDYFYFSTDTVYSINALKMALNPQIRIEK